MKILDIFCTRLVANFVLVMAGCERCVCGLCCWSDWYSKEVDVACMCEVHGHAIDTICACFWEGCDAFGSSQWIADI
jgi:hypothetical protein